MLVGKRLILEEIDPKNVEQLRQWRNDPSLRRYFREYRDISKDMQNKWYAERGNNSNPEHIYFQIMERKLDSNGEPVGLERKLIGCMGGHYIDWRLGSVEFGIFIGDEDARGKGLGKEALVMMFDYLFFELKMHKIWCEIYTNNLAITLYRDKLKMQEEGRLRHTQFCDGEWLDSIMLSVLEDEWRTFRKENRE